MSNINFGTMSAGSNPGLSFGGGGGFGGTSGAPIAGTPGFSVGGLGGPNAATTSTNSTFGGVGFSFDAASQPVATAATGGGGSFGFGGSGPTSSAPPATSGTPSFSGFFSNAAGQAGMTTTTSTANLGLGGGLGGFGLPSSATSTSVFSTTTVPSTGLGSADQRSPLTSGLGKTTTTKPNDIKTVKDNTVLPEVLATVEEFNKHVKAQKSVRENIARMTAKPLFKVEDDLKDLRQQLHEIATMLQKNSTSVEKLKKEATQELKNVEIVQRTKDTPPGLQYENLLPTEYFQKLADDFERQMSVYRQQFLEAENFFASINHSTAASPAELASVFTMLNDGFVALAAKLQVVHESVKTQKDSYLQFRKRQLCDNTDIFRRAQNGRTNASESLMKGSTTYGPSPFSYGSSVASVAFSSALNQMTSQNPTTQPQVGFGLFNQQSGFVGTSNSTLFNNSNSNLTFNSPGFGVSAPVPSATQTPFFGSTASPAPLQKTGNKRGKNA